MSTSTKFTVGIVSLVIAAWIMTTGATTAAEAAVRMDVNSAYVWRGITLNDGMVVQPSLDVEATSNLAINVWGNFNVDDYGGWYTKNEFSEVDLTLTYSTSIGPVDVGLSLAQYLYPHQAETNGVAVHGTRELNLNLETPLIGDLSVVGLLSYDTEESNDIYASLGLKYEMELGSKLSGQLDASAGYAGKRWAEANSEGAESGLHDYTFAAAVAYTLNDSVSCGANLGYTGSLDKDVLPEQDVDLYGGVSVSVGF